MDEEEMLDHIFETELKDAEIQAQMAAHIAAFSILITLLLGKSIFGFKRSCLCR